jgi:hypothetical protein
MGYGRSTRHKNTDMLHSDHAHTPKGMTVYDNDSEALERAPVVFWTEVERVFKSR